MAYYDAFDAAKIAEIAAVNGEIIAMRSALDAAERKALALRSRGGLTFGYKMDLAEKATKLAKNAMDAFYLLEMKSRFAMRRKLLLEKKKQTCESCCSARPSIPELDGLTEEELMSVSVGAKRIRE